MGGHVGSRTHENDRTRVTSPGEECGRSNKGRPVNTNKSPYHNLRAQFQRIARPFTSYPASPETLNTERDPSSPSQPPWSGCHVACISASMASNVGPVHLKCYLVLCCPNRMVPRTWIVLAPYDTSGQCDCPLQKRGL
ncbi:hypothetical protein ACFX2J_020894 [Malus domestica]